MTQKKRTPAQEAADEAMLEQVAVIARAMLLPVLTGARGLSIRPDGDGGWTVRVETPR